MVVWVRDPARMAPRNGASYAIVAVRASRVIPSRWPRRPRASDRLACPTPRARLGDRSSLAVKVVVHVDGGARGNPGPAAAACVITSARGELLGEHTRVLGSATNNVAEYRAVLLGLEHAQALGATDVEIIGDSELIAKQLTGAYKVKHEAMRELHREATSALAGFGRWSIRTVPRAQNARADALVNAALDQARAATRE
jgi:ribonuclease HI